MRICAECFKADEWKNKFNLQNLKNNDTCDFCGKKHATADFNSCFKPYLLKLLAVLKTIGMANLFLKYLMMISMFLPVSQLQRLS